VKWVVVSGTLSEAPATPAGTIYVRQGSAPQGWVVEPNDSGRNQLHNALFNVQQRGAGPFTATNAYTADRWQLGVTGDSANITQAAIADAGRTAIGDDAASYALSNSFTGNAAAGSFNYIAQKIEGVRRLGGKTVTVSFWATAGAAGLRVGVSADQFFGTGGSPSATVHGTGTAVPITTTWARYSVTLALGSTIGKTRGTNGDDFTQLTFWYSAGSSNSVTSGIGVQSGVINFWGMQLEVGALATPLEKLDPQIDLAKCQRFYQQGTAGGMAGYGSASMTAAFPLVLQVSMRATPTVTTGAATSYSNVTGVLVSYITPGELYVTGTVSTLNPFNLGNVPWTASADL
jgi:hypothetical protein